MQYDVIVIGAGLAGIVATTEIAARGKRVLLLDQEGEQSIGGQAWWWAFFSRFTGTKTNGN